MERRAVKSRNAVPGGTVIEAERRLRVAQHLFVRRALLDTLHFVHGVDDLGIRWHSGLILSESRRWRIGEYATLSIKSDWNFVVISLSE